MFAITNSRYGSPAVLKTSEIARPYPGPEELCVRVHYAGVNRTDDGFLRAKPFVTRFFTGLFAPRYPSLGCEFAGTVESVGSKVTAFQVGDRVFGFDDAQFGGYCEFKTIKAHKMITLLPSNVSFVQGAASSEGAHYALCYINYKPVREKQRWFVHGATGSIGSAAVQFLKQRGKIVVASAPTQHVATVRALGADSVVDWQRSDICEAGSEFDVFFDSVGKSNFAEAQAMLVEGGYYLSSELGKRMENVWLSLANPLQKVRSKRNIAFVIPSANKQLIEELAAHLENGSFKPLIDKVYEASEIREAFEYVETGQKTGNVVVKICAEKGT